jgi:hypothetical protein
MIKVNGYEPLRLSVCDDSRLGFLLEFRIWTLTWNSGVVVHRHSVVPWNGGNTPHRARVDLPETVSLTFSSIGSNGVG